MRTIKIINFLNRVQGKLNPEPRTLNPEKAFTLVELLIAASIIGMISIAILSSFGIGFHTFERVQAFGGSQMDILLSIEEIERDLRNTFPLSGIPFTGNSQNMTFAGLFSQWDEEKEEETVVLGKKSYSLDSTSKALVRKQQEYSRAIAESTGTEQEAEILAFVEDLQFSYYYYKKELQDDKEKIEFGWKNSWGQEDGLPKGVKIEVTFRNGEKDVHLARTVFIPIGGSTLTQEEQTEGEGG